MAFIARLTMACETGSNGAAGGSGVPQSINISSDSPSAISDSFCQSEATPGTKKNSDFLLENQHLSLSMCYSSRLSLFLLVFLQGIPKLIVNPYPQGERQHTISQQE